MPSLCSCFLDIVPITSLVTALFLSPVWFSVLTTWPNEESINCIFSNSWEMKGVFSSLLVASSSCHLCLGLSSEALRMNIHEYQIDAPFSPMATPSHWRG